MESTLAAQEDGILSSLDYALPKMASYVTQREEVVNVPSGASFRPDGVRLLRIPIKTDGFVDASTMVLEATIRN